MCGGWRLLFLLLCQKWWRCGRAEVGVCSVYGGVLMMCVLCGGGGLHGSGGFMHGASAVFLYTYSAVRALVEIQKSTQSKREGDEQVI